MVGSSGHPKHSCNFISNLMIEEYKLLLPDTVTKYLEITECWIILPGVN